MKSLVIILSCIIAVSTSHAGENSKETAINLLMDKSGINRQLSQVPQQLMQSVKQKAAQSTSPNKPNMVFSALMESIQHAYKLNAIKQEISNTLNTNLTNDDVINILGWFASDIGQRITAQEIKVSDAATTPAGVADMNAFMERLRMREPSNYRLSMIKDLNNAIHATDFMVDTTLNTTMAFMQAMQKTLPPEAQEQMNNANMEQQIQTQRLSLLPVFAQVVERTLLYTYQDITDEDLSSYINFCKSAAGKKFYEISFLALKGSLNKANTEMANYFAGKIQLKTPPPTVPYNIPDGMAMPPR